MSVVKSLAAAAACVLLASPLALAAPAGPQQENSHGRTLLPMPVSATFHFREIGPALAGGRVTAVAGIAGNPDIYYVGGADGGVFRTEDGGITWQALFQHESVASIGALAVDPRNPAVVWVGTGEANVRNDVSYGNGVYESTDGGTHWRHLGLAGTMQISRILIDPRHPDTVLIGAMGNPWKNSTERGVYRTTNGGASWQRVLYIGPEVGISDMAMDPRNPNIVYAATYRFRREPWHYSAGGPEDAIYKSIDGGASWQRLSGHGLPRGAVGRIGLAVAPSAPHVVYAVIGSHQGVLWRSDDAGANWTLLSKDQSVDARPFYFSHIAVDPKNPNHLFALSMRLLTSSDGGRTWRRIARSIHVDNHAIWIDPTGSGRIIEGNDGGVALSLDNGRHWAFVHNIAIGQLYHVSVSGGFFYQVCGGLQDNNSWCGPGASKDPSGISSRAWYGFNGDDGIYGMTAADDPNLIYNEGQNGAYFIYNRAEEQLHDIEPFPRDDNGRGADGARYRFAWEAAFAVSPSNPKVLYAGGNVVFRSANRGRTWKVISPDLTRNDKAKQGPSGGPVIEDNSGAEYYDTILTITPAASDPQVLWVGTDDGLVQVTRDGGKHWSNVTANIPHLPAWGRVESIDVSPTDPGRALIAVDRHFSGDFRPYLYRTRDYGAHWRSISGNLPQDVYAHVVRCDRHDPDLYYAGLENGLYVSWDAGRRWYQFGLGLPDAAVYDLALQSRTNSLVVATHGRGVWVLDDLTPFEQWSAHVAHAALTLFKPEDAVRYWPFQQTESMGDGAFFGEDPHYGASFSYYLARPVSESGELIITNAAGHVVRTYQGLHKGKPAPMTPPPARAPVAAKGEVPWVSGAAGLHRVYWDLTAQGPVRWHSAPRFNRGPRSGALLPPGTYTATLKIGGASASQRFAVVNDPASRGTLAGMTERYRVTEAVLHEVSQIDVALNRLHSLAVQLQALKAAVQGLPEQRAVDAAIARLARARHAVLRQLTSDAGSSESTLWVPDGIHEKLLALDGLLWGSDEPVDAATLHEKARYDAEYRSALAAYDQFLSTAVSAFNQTVSGDGVNGVVGGTPLAP
jgi:photosystem II stability/assembly factor-like uncharacterized protein